MHDKNFKPIIAIVGSRQLSGIKIQQLIRNAILTHPLYPNVAVISGACRGVDTEAENVANELGLEFQDYPAKWDKLGLSAGNVRNKLMAELCTEAIAIYETRTKGTTNMINHVVRLKKPLREIIVSANYLF